MGPKRSGSKRKERRWATNRVEAQRDKLQTSYHQQELLVQQQQTLLVELAQRYQELLHLAFTDALTGLPNYRAVISRLHEAVARGTGAQKSCGVLFVDLDQFKRVNDIWGHRAGDWLLYEIAHRMCTVVGPENFVGRYGGEEFVILLPEVDLQMASQMAVDVHSAIVTLPYFWQHEMGSSAVPIFITASIGVAIASLHGCSAEVLIDAADRAMYQAKSAGGGVRLADTERAVPSARLSWGDLTKNAAGVAIDTVAQELLAIISAYDQQSRAIRDVTYLYLYLLQRLPHDIQRPCTHFVIDATKGLADNAQKDELNTTKKEY